MAVEQTDDQVAARLQRQCNALAKAIQLPQGSKCYPSTVCVIGQTLRDASVITDQLVGPRTSFIPAEPIKITPALIRQLGSDLTARIAAGRYDRFVALQTNIPGVIVRQSTVNGIPVRGLTQWAIEYNDWRTRFDILCGRSKRNQSCQTS